MADDDARQRVSVVIEGLHHGVPGQRSERIIREEMATADDLGAALSRAAERIRVEGHNNRGGRV